MRNRLLALTAALAIAALASWTPNAEAFIIYCSDTLCEGQPESTTCICPPGSDKEGKKGKCGEWNSISVGGCWYF